MGSINIRELLSTFLWPAMLIHLSNIERNVWECQESNRGPLSEKQECYLCAKQPPISWFYFELTAWLGGNPQTCYPAVSGSKLGSSKCSFKCLESLSWRGTQENFFFVPNPGSFIYLKTGTLQHCTTDDWTNIASHSWNRWAIKT